MAGVCQTWGPDPVSNGRCCGRYDSTASVLGLRNSLLSFLLIVIV
jgi:hypothetical protein